MAKDSNSNNRKIAEKKPDVTKYILLAVVILVAGYFSYTLFFQKDDVKNPVFVDPKERIKNIKEPAFKKEGELEFMKNEKEPLKKIEIEIAENDAERTQGLMYRKSMDDTKGMLFIFQREEPQSFWMKNTIIPLDIIYVNSKREIVKIYKNTTPFSENSLPSGKPATYVVEVAGGYTDRYGIKEGDLIRYSRD
ncbi:MAG: DUF192 domain-containing protein [Ignavibacteriae bacterium]|nr:DUF192 domain-containing protein [Ignavibacteriota bacterium]